MVFLAVMLVPAAAWADTAKTSSSNYQLSEIFFGSGGSLNECSTNFCTKTSAGETTIGNSSSSNYQVHAGFNTNRDPYIQLVTNDTSTNLGYINTKSTATATAKFSVETYLAHGYEVITASPPPSDGGYFLNSYSTPTAPQPGTEGFGMNLVANTSPASFGSNPTYTPDSTYSFGIVDSSYDQPNLFMYHQGGIIALSNQSTSFTNYTISYVFDISSVTPAGNYTFNDVLVATGTY